MNDLNRRCESIKVSYIKTPKLCKDNVLLDGYYDQKVSIVLTKEQMNDYNQYIKTWKKENIDGIDTMSTLKEGDNFFERDANIHFDCYFWRQMNNRFIVDRSTVIQVKVS